MGILDSVPSTPYVPLSPPAVGVPPQWVLHSKRNTTASGNRNGFLLKMRDLHNCLSQTSRGKAACVVVSPSSPTRNIWPVLHGTGHATATGRRGQLRVSLVHISGTEGGAHQAVQGFIFKCWEMKCSGNPLGIECLQWNQTFPSESSWEMHPSVWASSKMISVHYKWERTFTGEILISF